MHASQGVLHKTKKNASKTKFLYHFISFYIIVSLWYFNILPRFPLYILKQNKRSRINLIYLITLLKLHFEFVVKKKWKDFDMFFTLLYYDDFLAIFSFTDCTRETREGDSWKDGIKFCILQQGLVNSLLTTAWMRNNRDSEQHGYGTKWVWVYYTYLLEFFREVI